MAAMAAMAIMIGILCLTTKLEACSIILIMLCYQNIFLNKLNACDMGFNK